MDIDYVIIPNNLSAAVVKSQVIDKFSNGKTSFIYQSRNVNLYNCLFNRSLSPLRSAKYVYVRSVFDFVTVSIFRLTSRAKFLTHFDFRGFISDESYLRNKSRIRYSVLRIIERYAYVTADSVSCVSINMKNELYRRFGERKVDVVPCCIRRTVVNRRERTVKEPLQFCYVGSMSKWQGFEEAIRCFMSVIKQVEARLTVLTKDIKMAEEICKAYNLIDVIEIRSVERDKVFEYLDVMDFGFLVRNDNVINRTASPVKFAEYVARGVTPIITRFVGDYSDLYKENLYVIEDKCKSLSVKKLFDLRTPEKVDALYDIASDLCWERYENESNGSV